MNFLKILSKKENKILLIYDLDKVHAGYDFFTFYSNGLTYAKINNIKNFDVCIISGTYKGFKKYQFKKEGKNKVLSAELRLKNILIDSIFMFKNRFDNFYFYGDRKEAEGLIKQYNYTFPKAFSFSYKNKHIYADQIRGATLEKQRKISKPVAINNIFSDKIINDKLSNEKFVTITLRESSYNKKKNSNLKEWEKFTKYLLKKKLTVIVIRDLEKILNNDYFRKFEVFPQASFDLNFRVGLYKKSICNLFTTNGPQQIANFNNLNSISFKEGEKYQNNYKKMSGIQKNFKSKILTNKQLYVFDEDNFKNIKLNFETFLKKNKIKIKK